MIDYRAALDELPDPLPIVPLEKPFDVTITPPGSKSITNRAYVLAALAEGESRIIRPLRAEDTDLLLEALCTLGAEARWNGEDVFIKGVGGRFPRGGSVYLGDGGTPTRFLIAAACLAAEPVVVDGSKRMRERPIAEGVEMLRQLGAKIEYVEEEGRLPVRVVPSDELKGGELRVGKTASSQFISALMLIAPWLSTPLRIVPHGRFTSEHYIELTCEVVAAWDIPVGREIYVPRQDPRHIHFGTSVISLPHSIHATSFEVEIDVSSAMYWSVAAAIVPTAGVRLMGLRWNTCQPDDEVLEALHIAGARVNAERGIVRGRHRLTTVSGDASGFPDGAMILAIAATRCAEASTITGLQTLRVKETDRLAALANELRKVGCTVETTEDSITITPPPKRLDSHGRDAPATEPVVIETYNDHRMAMSFAILGLVRPGIAIANPKCVAKSYPTFWRDFARLYG